MKKPKNDWDKGFVSGYVCAVANMIRENGDGTASDDLYKSCFCTVKELRAYGVDESDIEVLKPTIKEIERKNKNF